MLNTWSAAYWNRLFVLVLLAGMLFIGMTRVQPNDSSVVAAVSELAEQTPAAQIDHPAPTFSLPDLMGRPVSLSELKGQVVLITIWATWCPPCRAEMPTIQATYEQYHARGFMVLAINQAEDSRSVAAFMQQYGLTFPALLDSESTVSQLYQVRALPSSFFVDRNGIVRVVYRGPMPRSIISGTVERLLQEGN
jgi:peroxiredoxin